MLFKTQSSVPKVCSPARHTFCGGHSHCVAYWARQPGSMELIFAPHRSYMLWVLLNDILRLLDCRWACVCIRSDKRAAWMSCRTTANNVAVIVGGTEFARSVREVSIMTAGKSSLRKKRSIHSSHRDQKVGVIIPNRVAWDCLYVNCLLASRKCFPITSVRVQFCHISDCHTLGEPLPNPNANTNAVRMYYTNLLSTLTPHSLIDFMFVYSFWVFFFVSRHQTTETRTQSNWIASRRAWIKLTQTCVKRKKTWAAWKNVAVSVCCRAPST